MQTVNIHAAKTQLSRLVEQAAAGEEIIIAKAGKPICRLVPLAAATMPPRKLGMLAGKLDVPDSFDDPLPDALIDLFYKGPVFPEKSARSRKDER
ncbi:type II toxin-antitoxin system prevent-host-death family antitoxin [Accumulibacter sp.]|uniref:type II toxin-antitoxin system Phd/YefM family antitoxin n=1 Tax=Accumulibacter sp. TaxID=2053492 RepID=UPI001D6B3D52|nr:type II toxin-antitoxin system prevent-host-death family antitoxin [Accumulibacter sp.]MCB1968164.1 type II toxin-antitoxin system Phd/YefM family antitoxin [Accumulibacter sp.]MCP5229473.1 type II toxin-antitoxin system Phd/YefM family antitoxin [Accumulibacter sp.]